MSVRAAGIELLELNNVFFNIFFYVIINSNIIQLTLFL